MIKVFNKNNFYVKYNLFSFKNSKYYLIKWQPYMKTVEHNHPNVSCNFYLLKGSLKETVYKNNEIIKKNLLNNIFDKGYIDDSIGNHIVDNISSKNTYSLHIYKKLSN